METTGLTLTINREELDATTKRILEGVQDMSAVTPAIAMILTNSVRRNFIEGGRPEKWPVSQRAEREDGQTLIDTARLMNSITGEGDADSAMTGTNVAYAPAQNLGVDKEITQHVKEHARIITQAFGREITPKKVTVRAHERDVHLHIDPRRFMMAQPEDLDDIGDVVMKRIQQLIQGS